MITNFKIYEQKIKKYFEGYYNKKEIWKIPTKTPDYYIAKWKIGAGNSMNTIYGKNDYQLLHYNDHFPGGKNRNDNWSWSDVDSHSGLSNIKFIYTPEYMGEVEITQDDIDGYYVEKEAEKYNL